MQARPYQLQAITKLIDWLWSEDGNPLVVMPTGSGKSFVIAEFIRRAIETHSETRILLLTHVKELLVQDYSALIRLWPDAPAGLYSTGLDRHEIDSQILVAGIQSIHRKAYDVQRCDLVLIDEAHLIGRNANGMYSQFLKQLREINPYLRVVGFTATPYRMDTGLLHEGKDALFTGVAHEVALLDLMNDGYLCRPVTKATNTQIDLSNVGTRGGDFIAAQLEAAIDISEITAAAVDEIVQAGEKRGSWLIFCAGVPHAEHVRDEILKWGISCETVTGATPTPERDRLLRDFKAGKLRALTSVGVLTTGFDAPGIDLIALLRPTKSLSLHVQMLGRGTRLAEGKDDCLVLDFAGNTMRHAPLDTVDGRKRAKKDDDLLGDAPAKKCPECKEIVAASLRECTCGHQFPPPRPMLSSKSVTAPMLSSDIRPTWIPVDAISYARHSKAGSPDSLVVEYTCGLSRHREWIGIEQPGFRRQKACEWWHTRMPGRGIPSTVTDALAMVDDLAVPATISVKPDGQYTAIVGARFA